VFVCELVTSYPCN